MCLWLFKIKQSFFSKWEKIYAIIMEAEARLKKRERSSQKVGASTGDKKIVTKM